MASSAQWKSSSSIRKRATSLARHLTPLMLAALLLLTLLSSATTATASYTNVVYFTPTLYPTRSNTTYPVGQQVRVKLAAKVHESNKGFNRTTVRLSIAAMYANRAQNGVPIPCNSSQSSVYFDSGNLGISTYTASLGRYITYEAYTTFTVPPFPYRICVLNRPAFRSQYYSVEGQDTVTPRNYTELGVYFRASAIMQEGDFAAIAITKVGSAFPYQLTVPGTSGLDGDSLKLVPAGAPCTMERTLSRETAQTVDYCGSNRLTSDGHWTSTSCLLAGSVANGVARLGTNSVNPFVDATMTGFPRVVNTSSTERLVAYLQLPAYAVYDVCFSPLTYRKAMVDAGESIGQPLWFKIMSFTSACSSSSCPSRTRLQVTARLGTVTWSSLSSPIAGSYGSIRIRGAGDLNTNVATLWDPKCTSCTKEYFNTTGGDVFRLVNFNSFFAVPSFTAGSSVTTSGTSIAYGTGTSNAERTTIGVGAVGSIGSISPNSGCWISDDDNYGTEESPMSTGTCASCETGAAGQTASGDLGGDPRSGETAYKQNLNNQFLTYARVRIPSVGGTWRVCYRKAGINNWQYLDWDTLITKPYQGFFQGSTTNMIVMTESQMNTNFTYTLNDTRKGTWAQIAVASSVANMETTASNFFTTTVPQASVRGAMLKFIDVTKRCDDISQTAATALDGGLAECLPQQCSYLNGSCYGCSGSSDNTNTLRRLITFNLQIPSNLSSVRVCFRNRVENWRVLTPRFNRRIAMPLSTAADVNYTVSDTRTGSWGRFTFFHYNGGLIDTNTYTATRGAMFRIVPTSVRCDLIWTSSNTAQDYNNRTVDTRLGVHCSTTGTYPCLSEDVEPTSGNVVGSAPYTNLNPQTTTGAYVANASGFALIPAAGASYRVCFREAKTNWVELFPQLTPRAAPSFTISNPQAPYVAGSYAKITVAASNASINATTAILKIVPDDARCQFPAVGTYGTSGLIYTSFSTATGDGSRTIASGTATGGLYNAVNFYLTMPTLTGTPTTTSSYQRRVCFMPENSVTSNWVDLGRVPVVSYSVGFTVAEQPTNGKELKLTVMSGSDVGLTTGYSGDAVKVVPLRSPCASNESGGMPSDVSSFHAGLEIRNSNYDSTLNKTRGITYLGPAATAQRSVTVNLTLPGSASAVSYRVCYKLNGKVWMEILQTPTVNRTFDLGDTGFVTTASSVHTLDVDAAITGSTPAASYNYGGFLYPDLLIAGATTTFDPTTIGGSGSESTYFSVTGTGLSTSDTLRIVKVHDETQTLAQYSSVKVVSCADTSASSNIEATYNPYEVTSSTTAKFRFTLPITPARYIFCYQLSGASVWFQPGNTALNPATVIGAAVYGKVGDTDLTMTDGTQSLGANLGSLNAGDRIYIKSSTATCGVGTAYDGSTAVSDAVVGLTTTSINTSKVYNALIGDAPSWYPVTDAGLYSLCYTKAITNTTVQSSSLRPVLNSNVWYRLQFYINGYFEDDYRKLVGQASVSVTCPTSPRTTGEAFTVPISMRDPTNDEILTSYVPVTFTVVPTNDWVFINQGGSCSGSTLYNKSIASKTGEASFDLTALSSCPSGGCTFRFTSAATTNSSDCTFTLNAANDIASVQKALSASCALGSRCRVALAALDSANSIVYGSSDSVSLALAQSYPGLGFAVNGGSAITDLSSLSLSFTNGVLYVDFYPTVVNSTAWLAANASYSVSVTATVGGVEATFSFTVLRPSLASAAISAVTMVDWDGTPSNDVDANQHLRWEPSVTFPAGFWDKQQLRTTLQSGPSYPWIAGQYYKVRLVPLDPLGRPITDPAFYVGTNVSVRILRSNGSTPTTNWVIGQPVNASHMHSFQDALVNQSFDDTTIDIVFRLRSAEGCSRSSPCHIVFDFGSTDIVPSRIITAARSVARRLMSFCATPGSTNSALITNATCPHSVVEKGLSIAIRAVDQFGGVDEYFNGDVYVNVLVNNKSAGDSAFPTTVRQLKLSSTAMPRDARFVNGELFLPDFTLSYPCDNCVVQFFSDWNAGYAYLPVVFVPSTVRLTSILSPSSTYYLMNNDFNGVRSVYNATTQSDLEAYLMIYPSTDLCYDVTAVSATGEVTLYESLWVNYAVSGQGGASVTATPAAQTPYVYKPLNFSKGRYCFNVDSVNGATFLAVFIAQQFNDPTHWSSSYATGQSVTTTYRLSLKRLIGGLKLENMTGVTAVSGAPASRGVWGRTQLADVNTQATVRVAVQMLDHYGNWFNNTNLISSQVSFFLSPGSCSNAEISSGQCIGNGAPTSKLKVTPLLPIREGGVVSVILQTASYTLISTSLSFTFNVRRWCLKCDIPIVVYSGTTGAAYSDPVLGTISTTLSLSFLIPTSLPLYTAFRVGNSPFFPSAATTAGFVATKWRHWLPTATSRPSSANGSPMLFFEGCFNGTNASCSPNTNLYSYGKCASSNPEELTGADGGPMQFVVYRATQAMSYGESVCIGDCFTGSNIPTSQIDIFNAYTYRITAGTQRLQCTSTNTVCNGDGTTTITLTRPALGDTVDSALVALAASGDVAAAKVKLVGVDASTFTTVDAITGAMISGSGLASKAGPLIINTTSSTTTSTVRNLTSFSGSGSNAGLYYLMWRGPARATKMVVRTTAVDQGCPATGSYLAYTPIAGGQYTGYLQSKLLSAISVSYSGNTIPINTPFPFTVEIQDTNNNVVPSASGTIAVSIVDFTGCGNGGTASINGSNALEDGRVTLWVSFSESCDNCNIRFDLSANASQSDLYELVINSAQKQSVVVSGLKIGGSTQSAAVAAFATVDPTAQSANITIDDTISVTVAPYFNVGGIAVKDNASAIRIEAYNHYSETAELAGRRQVGGDGGLLRLSNETLNYDPASVYSTGIGSATVSFAFQRTCQYGCRVLIVWRIVSTNQTGTFYLANANGTVFFVSAPSSSPMLVAHGVLRKTIRYNAAFPYAVRTALMSNTIPFAGWAVNTTPSLIDPAITVVDSSDGTSGIMSKNVTMGIASIIYHLNFSEPCYECRIDFNPAVNVSTAIQATATQLRVDALTPLSGASNSTFTAHIYASDDLGFVDFSIGGQTRCAYEIPFLCNSTGRLLTIVPSQNGSVANVFSPNVTNYHVGGTYATGFSITTLSDFRVRNGQALLSFNVTGPAAKMVPIFTDGFFSTTPYPTFGLSIDASLSDLVVTAYLPVGQATIYERFELKAAMTVVSGGVRYVAPNANHTLLLTTSGECNMYLLDSSVYQRTNNGQVTYSMIFTSASASACVFTVTSVAGNGVCSTCSRSVSVISVQRVATSWDFLRPTPYVPEGTSTAILYASMVRSQVVTVQLYNLVGTRRQAQTCNGCALLFTPNSCSPSPSFSPSGGAIFNSNGTATVRVTWQISRDATQNSTIRTYSCALSTSISGTSIDGPYATSYQATVCYPNRLVLVNGTFDKDVYLRRLSTSKQYTFIVGSVDPYGTLCPGDSQYDVSTLVNVTLEYADGTATDTDLQVINLNRTTQSTNALSRTYNNTVYLNNGLFYFSLVFTNASDAPVRLKFSAFSKSPEISMSVTTPSFNVHPNIAGLAIYPSLPTKVSSARTYNFSLFAGDLVPYDWLSDAARVPNVYNTSADYYMMINRSFFTVNPLTFIKGSAVGALVNGTAEIGIRFTVPAGYYRFNFFSRYAPWIKASTPVDVRVETPHRFAFVTIGFYDNAPYLCTDDCFMPVTGTAFEYNATAALLSINTPRTFRYAVALVDENDEVVTSETGLTIGCQVLKDDNDVTANIAFAPSLVQTGPLYVPMSAGLANFSIGFIGTTLVAGSHSSVRIQCSCSSGTCPSVQVPTTLPIIVTTVASNSNISDAVGTTPIFKIPTTMTSLSEFNATNFRSSVVSALKGNGITYIQSDNAELSLNITVCAVQREFFGFADLRGYVCGPLNKCTVDNTTLCPPFVLGCICPSITTTTTTSRQLEALALTGTQLQIELLVTLANAPAFQPTSAAEVLAMYLTITHTLYDSLSLTGNTLWQQFSVVADTIVAATSTDPVVGATQTPVPGVFVTPVPATPAPSSASVAQLLGAVLALVWGAILTM